MRFKPKAAILGTLCSLALATPVSSSVSQKDWDKQQLQDTEQVLLYEFNSPYAAKVERLIDLIFEEKTVKFQKDIMVGELSESISAVSYQLDLPGNYKLYVTAIRDSGLTEESPAKDFIAFTEADLEARNDIELATYEGRSIDGMCTAGRLEFKDSDVYIYDSAKGIGVEYRDMCQQGFEIGIDLLLELFEEPTKNNINR